MNPWIPEKALWPIPTDVPADVAANFPGEAAIGLLVEMTAANFDTLEDARENAIGFVNYRRRKMAEEYAEGQKA